MRPRLARLKSRQVTGELDSEALLIGGIAGDSSPIRGGALGLPLGVGSELPAPCSSSCVLLTPAPAQLMGREFICAGIVAARPTGRLDGISG